MCYKLLTMSGWSPVNTIEAVIVGVRANLVEGGARLERGRNLPDYSEAEAKIAFDRLRKVHGW